MITRFDYKPPKKRDSSNDDEFITYSYEKKLIPLSKNEDGSIDKYEEQTFWKEEKSSWSEYIKSFDLGSVSKQVLDHIEKGTPLITAHTLPAGDYTQLEKGASIKREMAEKGITLEMLVEAFKSAAASQEQKLQNEGGAE